MLSSPSLAPNAARFLRRAGAVSKLQFDGPNANDVSVRKRRFRLYSGATEQSTIGAVEVEQKSASMGAVDADACVTAGYIRVIYPDIARRISSDDVVAFR